VDRELRQAFGDVIGDLRQERQLSQEALSLACGRHRTYISLLERGRNTPSIETLWVMADALEVEPVDLVSLVQARCQEIRRDRGAGRASRSSPRRPRR
jgi:transcriptional regulator with XRE-family HTH domain